ncbi:hypothetical protein PAECIP111891_04357 [Paenibacillus allorhizoplanae]|uniref:Uncharacterized protein n=1 Tax=Paenibacillus allorhizoplanae TaxID=2905648 RepID=A0ABM9CJH5_9BACL|nr:hypothetical protein PAECIP111891_04357 [Paenibacillus allorhizoplanae]
MSDRVLVVGFIANQKAVFGNRKRILSYMVKKKNHQVRSLMVLLSYASVGWILKNPSSATSCSISCGTER